MLPLPQFPLFPAMVLFRLQISGEGVSWGLPPSWRPLCPAGSARPPAMASPDGASGMGGNPEETELSITLTLRMLMHGKVMVGGLSPARGGQQCPGWGPYWSTISSPCPVFLPCSQSPREQHSQKDFFPHPKPGRGPFPCPSVISKPPSVPVATGQGLPVLPVGQAVGRGGMWQAGSCLLTGPLSSLPLQEIGSIIGKVRFGVRGTASPRLPWT